MKVYLYIVKSLRNERIYVGVTNCVESRLDKHNNGLVHSTKIDKPYRVIHAEEFENLLLARRREKFLKSHQGRRVLRNSLLNKIARHKEGGPSKSVQGVEDAAKNLPGRRPGTLFAGGRQASI